MSDQDEPKPRRLNIDEESQRYPLEKMTRGRARRAELRESSPEGRIPPQAVSVEQSVLGAMLIEREAIPRVVEILREDAFYTSKHQRIFASMLSLFERAIALPQQGDSALIALQGLFEAERTFFEVVSNLLQLGE